MLLEQINIKDQEVLRLRAEIQPLEVRVRDQEITIESLRSRIQPLEADVFRLSELVQRLQPFEQQYISVQQLYDDLQIRYQRREQEFQAELIAMRERYERTIEFQLRQILFLSGNLAEAELKLGHYNLEASSIHQHYQGQFGQFDGHRAQVEAEIERLRSGLMGRFPQLAEFRRAEFAVTDFQIQQRQVDAIIDSCAIRGENNEVFFDRESAREACIQIITARSKRGRGEAQAALAGFFENHFNSSNKGQDGRLRQSDWGAFFGKIQSQNFF